MTRRAKIYILVLVVSLAYLLLHELVFDGDYRTASISRLIENAGEHIWHVAPVILAFLVLLGKDLYDRSKGNKID